jgi:hypothetical protein
MKLLVGCTLLVWSFTGVAQNKYAVTTASVTLTSNAQLELIKASCLQVQGLIDPHSNQFAFAVDVKSFRGFNSDLQREHFNEKYMESEKFPKATFSGKIIEAIDWNANGTHEVRAKGELDIHGHKQTRIIRAKINITNGAVKVESRFMVPLADHDISIPSIVSQKIATEIEIDFQAKLTSK